MVLQVIFVPQLRSKPSQWRTRVKVATPIPLVEERLLRFGVITVDAAQIVQFQTYPSESVVRNDGDVQYQ